MRVEIVLCVVNPLIFSYWQNDTIEKNLPLQEYLDYISEKSAKDIGSQVDIIDLTTKFKRAGL
jgi:hypothetical protein